MDHTQQVYSCFKHHIAKSCEHKEKEGTKNIRLAIILHDYSMKLCVSVKTVLCRLISCPAGLTWAHVILIQLPWAVDHLCRLYVCSSMYEPRQTQIRQQHHHRQFPRFCCLISANCNIFLSGKANGAFRIEVIKHTVEFKAMKYQYIICNPLRWQCCRVQWIHLAGFRVPNLLENFDRRYFHLLFSWKQTKKLKLVRKGNNHNI